MAKKKQEININNIETRLKDAKREYELNLNLINMLADKIQELNQTLIIENPNGTYSLNPTVKAYQEVSKANITLRKQINDMEIQLQNGVLKQNEEINPFE